MFPLAALTKWFSPFPLLFPHDLEWTWLERNSFFPWSAPLLWNRLGALLRFMKHFPPVAPFRHLTDPHKLALAFSRVLKTCTSSYVRQNESNPASLIFIMCLFCFLSPALPFLCFFLFSLLFVQNSLLDPNQLFDFSLMHRFSRDSGHFARLQLRSSRLTSSF